MKNDDIHIVDDLVSRVKRRKDIGIRYMQSWEYMATMKREAREEGLAEGRAEGRAEGIITTLCELLDKGLLSLEDAAQQAGLSPEDFLEKRAQGS